MNKYILPIDNLRGIAVLSVMIYHVYPTLLPGGFLGVDIFFVVSGFIVSLSLDNYPQLRFAGFVKEFYKRRVKRLFPALYFCVLVFLIFAVTFFDDSKELLKAGIMSLVGIGNMFFLFQNEGYFSPSIGMNLFLHTWSLGVEEQFYLVYPFIFFFATEVVLQRNH